MPNRATRKKISTTIAPENAAFLKVLLKRGTADSLADAVDHVIDIARQAEARERLEAATEKYFNSLSQEDAAEENRLGAALAYESGKVNFNE
jgi:hypothetical protein